MGYEIFAELCRQKAITPTAVGRLCGIDSATMSNWKNGKYTPKEDKRRRLAEFFGVSLEYLDTGVEPQAKEMTAAQIRNMYFNEHPEHRALFEIMEEVPEDKLPLVVSIIKGILNAE